MGPPLYHLKDPVAGLPVPRVRSRGFLQDSHTKYLTVSPRQAYQGGQGKQLSKPICYKETGTPKPVVSKLNGLNGTEPFAQQQCRSHERLLPDPASPLTALYSRSSFTSHQTIPVPHKTLHPTGDWPAGWRDEHSHRPPED